MRISDWSSDVCSSDLCKAIQVMVFMKNHEGATIAHAVHEAKRFIADHPVDGVKIRLASGNVGVMAATNEAVESAEAKMLLAIFGALALLCLLTFRSWRATICVRSEEQTSELQSLMRRSSAVLCLKKKKN